MREVRGFVLIEACEGRRLLFGKPVTDPDWQIQNLSSNDLTPFPTLALLRRAASRMPPERVSAFTAARLKMSVAETQDDLEALSVLPPRQRSFVIVIGKGEGLVLQGKAVPGEVDAFDGRGDMTCGARPFTDFADADHCASEAARQSLEATTVAGFWLEEV